MGEVLENMVHILENVPDDLVVGVHGQLQVSQQGLVAIFSTRGGMVPLCSDSTCERSSPILLSSPFWTTTVPTVPLQKSDKLFLGKQKLYRVVKGKD